MKVPIEIEVPDGALLESWVTAFAYMDDDGERRVGCDYSNGMDGTTQIGLLIGDAVRADQAAKWGPRERD